MSFTPNLYKMCILLEHRSAVACAVGANVAIMHDERHGAKQPERFRTERAAALDDTARFAYVSPERIVELLAIPAAGTVLDFGTGTGTYAIEIARRAPHATVLALDEQPEMLAKLAAKPEAATLANLRAVEPKDLGSYTSGVERIFAFNVLHELGDDALRALVGLLRRDGLALVVDWSADVERPVGPPNDHVYGADDARARLEAFGLTVERVDGFPYHHAFLARPA